MPVSSAGGGGADRCISGCMPKARNFDSIGSSCDSLGCANSCPCCDAVEVLNEELTSESVSDTSAEGDNGSTPCEINVVVFILRGKRELHAL